MSIGQAVSSPPVPEQRPDLLDTAKCAERPFPRAVSRAGRIGTSRA
jgi:hypothetical protein